MLASPRTTLLRAMDLMLLILVGIRQTKAFSPETFAATPQKVQTYGEQRQKDTSITPNDATSYRPSDRDRQTQRRQRQARKGSSSRSPYPAIDISPWMLPSSSTWEEKDEVVRQVLEQGMKAQSFNVVGHGISKEFLGKAVQAAKDFFNLPLLHKRTFSEEGRSGGYSYTSLENAIVQETYTMLCDPESQDNNNVEATASFQRVQEKLLEQIMPVEEALSEILAVALSITREGALLPIYSTAENGVLRRTGCNQATSATAEDSHATPAKTLSGRGSLSIVHGPSDGLEGLRDGRWVKVPADTGHLNVELECGFNANIFRISSSNTWDENDRVSISYVSHDGGKAET